MGSIRSSLPPTLCRGASGCGQHSVGHTQCCPQQVSRQLGGMAWEELSHQVPHTDDFLFVYSEAAILASTLGKGKWQRVQSWPSKLLGDSLLWGTHRTPAVQEHPASAPSLRDAAVIEREDGARRRRGRLVGLPGWRHGHLGALGCSGPVTASTPRVGRFAVQRPDLESAFKAGLKEQP